MLTELFFSFLQIGLFSIGGGYVAIPLIQQQGLPGTDGCPWQCSTIWSP